MKTVPSCFSKTMVPCNDIVKAFLLQNEIKRCTQTIQHLDWRCVWPDRPKLVKFKVISPVEKHTNWLGSLCGFQSLGACTHNSKASRQRQGFLWSSQSNINFPLVHVEIKGTNWWHSIHQQQCWMPWLICTPSQPPMDLSRVHIQKPWRRPWGWGVNFLQEVHWSSWSSIIHSSLFSLPWCPSSLLMNPKVQPQCVATKWIILSMPVNSAKKPNFRIYVSQIVFTSEMFMASLAPTCTERNF